MTMTTTKFSINSFFTSILLLILFLLLVSISAFSQFTNVSATVSDPSGSLYVNCAYTASWINQSSSPILPLINGGGPFQQQVSGQCDSFGSLNTRLVDVNQLNVSPSQWNFSICSDPKQVASGQVVCFSTLVTITGASQDISTTLKAAAAFLPGNSIFGTTHTWTANQIFTSINSTVQAICDNTGATDVGACFTSYFTGIGSSVHVGKGTYTLNTTALMPYSQNYLTCEPDTKFIVGPGIWGFKVGPDPVLGIYPGAYTGAITGVCQFISGDPTSLGAVLLQGTRQTWDIDVFVQGGTVCRDGVHACSGFTVAGIQGLSSWDVNLHSTKISYPQGDGFLFSNLGNAVWNSNAINFDGTKADHLDGIPYHIKGMSSFTTNGIRAENSGGGCVSLEAVRGGNVKGYFESCPGFDVLLDGATSGIVISGGSFTNALENNHKNIWNKNAGGTTVIGNAFINAGGMTGGIPVYADTGTTNISQLGNTFSADSGSYSVQGIGGPLAGTNAVTINCISLQCDFYTNNFFVHGYHEAVSPSGSNKAIASIRNAGTGDSNTGWEIIDENANAASRNYAITINKDAFGDLAILRSNVKGGNPFTAGSELLNFDPTGLAKFFGIVNAVGGFQINGATFADTSRAIYVSAVKDTSGLVTMGITPKRGSGAGNYTGANAANYVNVDTTNLCGVVTIPVGWNLSVNASATVESLTAAVAQSFALSDIGTTCGGAGVTALAGSERIITPPAAGVFNSTLATQVVITGDGAAHAISLQAKTSNVADSWGIQNTSLNSAPSMTFILTPSN